MIRSAGCSNRTSGSSPRQALIFSSARTTPRISLSSGLASLRDPVPAHRRGRGGAGAAGRPPQNRNLRHQLYHDGARLPGALGRREIEWLIPDEADRKLIHHVIFDELCLGEFNESRAMPMCGLSRRWPDNGCDAVALVCTEIPLLITADVSPLPVLDSTRLLARAAVDVAIGERPMPEWRGGPSDARCEDEARKPRRRPCRRSAGRR